MYDIVANGYNRAPSDYVDGSSKLKCTQEHQIPP